MWTLLKPTREKLIVSFVNSLVLILIFLIFPSLGFQSVFLSRELPRQILSLAASLLFGFVVYYPFACGLVYLFKAQNLAIALLFIIIFNPLTFSLVSMNILKTNQEKLCGLQIVEVSALSAKNAGLAAGEVIKTINDYPVENMDDLTHALANKRANDIVAVITNAKTYNVTLFANPQNPEQVLLGIKVKPTACDL